MSHKYKVTFWALVPVLLLTGIIVIVRMNNEPEPLTNREIMSKKDWTKDELAFTLARSFKHQSGRQARREVLEHLHKQMQRFSESEQEKIKAEAISQATEDSIRQYRALKQDEKAKLLAAIKKRAEKNYQSLNKMSSSEREKVRQRINSGDGATAVKAVQKAMLNKLTPEERRDFAPIERMWINTLERL
ncbi:MAG: hypothetical protein JXR78_14475 [Victivallales bacterium]|nr:hypothetical protein [Victivallales bacterium]